MPFASHECHGLSGVSSVSFVLCRGIFLRPHLPAQKICLAAYDGLAEEPSAAAEAQKKDNPAEVSSETASASAVMFKTPIAAPAVAAAAAQD